MSDSVDPPVWVAVLLDWQNIYRCAREAFQLDAGPSTDGTIDPLKLARYLTGPGRSLQEVRIYRGRPDNAKDPKGYSAWRSQTSDWQRACGRLLVERYRDLRYRGDLAVEKGIDVWMAIDLVRLSMEQSADRVVVVSSDTDLVPALELAVELRGNEFVEVAGWEGPGDSAALLSVVGVDRHRLTRSDYDRLNDPTDYSLGVRVRRKTSWDAQITAEGRRRRPST